MLKWGLEGMVGRQLWAISTSIPINLELINFNFDKQIIYVTGFEKRGNLE